MKTIGILTNGGDTCSLNAVIAAIKNAAQLEGFNKVYGFQGGYRGLIAKNVIDITDLKIAPNQGGSILYSLRDSPVAKDESSLSPNEKSLWDAKRDGALQTIKDLDLDALVAIGGDGSLAATQNFSQYVKDETGCMLFGFPRTIDNDIDTSTYHNHNGLKIKSGVAPGYSTAFFNIALAAKKLRTTANTTKRVFTIETMGRDAGWLALAIGYGDGEIVLIPEIDISENIEQRLYDRVAENYRISNSVIVGVSEGIQFDGVASKQVEYGARKLGGAGDIIALGGKIPLKGNDGEKKYRKIIGIQQGLRDRGVHDIVYPNGHDGEEDFALTIYPEVRNQSSGYTPRMGSPSAYDLTLAQVLGDRFRLMLREGVSNHLPVLDEIVPIDELDVRYTKALDIAEVKQMLLPVGSYYDTEALAPTHAFLDLGHTILSPEERERIKAA